MVQSTDFKEILEGETGNKYSNDGASNQQNSSVFCDS